MTSSVAPGPVAGARPAVAAEPVVELVSIVKRFGHVTAIDGVSLRFLPGQFVAILGPSGCGKTTLLRMIAGFETPTAGDVRIDGSSVAAVPPYRRQVNTVFQHYALFPHMDVASNVGYGLRQRRPAPPRAEQERLVDEALALVRLAGYGRRRSWQLSGGQQQRVALARALINRPRVLLLDEPLGALDLKLRREMQVELKRLQREVGITFVFVTHDQTEALAMADRITVMRDGRVLQDGPPDEVYDAPHDRWTADFIGQMNFIPGVVEAAASDVDVASGLRPWELRTPGGERYRGLTRNDALAPGDRAAIAIRPERLRVRLAGTAAEASGASDGNDAAAGGGGVANGRRLTGRVVVATYLGDQTELELDVPALGRVLARIPNAQGGGRAPSAGEEVIVDWDDRAARIVSDH